MWVWFKKDEISRLDYYIWWYQNEFKENVSNSKLKDFIEYKKYASISRIY